MVWRRRASLHRGLALLCLPALLIAGAAGSCSLAGLASGGSGGMGGSSGSDGSSGSSGSGEPDAAASCPADMVLITAGRAPFCIDRLEVKNGDYAAFAAHAPTTPQTDPPGCAWNTAYASRADAGDPDLPVVAIDWCDAYAYCASLGKHLCGTVGDGGALDFAARDTANAQWMTACSEGFMTKYPYGNVLDYAACNACDPDAGCVIDARPDAGPHIDPAAAKVGSFPRCRSSESDAPLDLSGNVWEWEGSCNPTGGDAGPAMDTCSMRGGSFLVPYARRQCLACSIEACGLAIGARNSTAIDVGLRCCKELP